MQKEIKAMMASRKRALKAVSRKFPKFHNGMSTHDYVRAYYAANILVWCHGLKHSQQSHAGRVLEVINGFFEPLNRSAATLYDPIEPLCVEELSA